MFITVFIKTDIGPYPETSLSKQSPFSHPNTL